jgi:hypothetical protein
MFTWKGTQVRYRAASELLQRLLEYSGKEATIECCRLANEKLDVSFTFFNFSFLKAL